MKNWTDRLFGSGLAATILGVALITLSAYMYATEKSEVGAGILLGKGILLLRAKSSLIGLKDED